MKWQQIDDKTIMVSFNTGNLFITVDEANEGQPGVSVEFAATPNNVIIMRGNVKVSDGSVS
jgi:hypothetical protein